MRSRQSNTTIHLSRRHACLKLAKALCGQVIANVRPSLHYDLPTTKEIATNMSTNDDYDFYERFCEETELKAKAKSSNRGLLVLFTRVIVILLLWDFFVRPHLGGELSSYILVLFVYIQLIAFSTRYLPYVLKIKRWFRQGGLW